MSRLPDLLHIDESDAYRDLLVRAFSASGVRAALHSFGDAAQALLFLNQLGPYVRAARPRQIQLDVGLPRIDGHGFLDLLRGNPRFATIPVLLLDDAPDQHDSSRSGLHQSEDRCLKPTTQQGLIDLLRSHDHWLMGSSVSLPASPLPS